MEGMEPIDGLDEPLRPLNMVEENEAEDIELDTEAAEPPDQEAKEPPEPGDNSTAMRMRALLKSNAERMARRVMKDSTIAPAVLAEALAISEEKAANWLSRPVDEDMNLEKITASMMALGETA
jgi:hypothetical protein